MVRFFVGKVEIRIMHFCEVGIILIKKRLTICSAMVYKILM